MPLTKDSSSGDLLPPVSRAASRSPPRSGEERPLARAADAITWLRAWSRAGSAVIYAKQIGDDGSDGPFTAHRVEWSAPILERKARELVANYNGLLCANLYFSPNIPRLGLPPKRYSKIEYEHAQCCHVDFDPPKGVDDASLDAWRAEALARVRAFDPQPSHLLTSGRGFGIFWRFTRPVPLREHGDFEEVWAERVARVENKNRDLAEALGADPSTADVSRIMKLPHTTAYMDARKRARGFLLDRPAYPEKM